MADEISEDGNYRWDGFDWKPIQSESHESKARKGPPSIEDSIMNKRKLRGGPPTIEDSIYTRGQNRSQDSNSKNVKPTYSEDGLWMWNGEEWIPAPPSGRPEHNISNGQLNETVLTLEVPLDEQRKIVKNVYNIGKQSITTLAIFLSISIPTAIICFFLTYDSNILDPGILATINIIIVVGYLVIGLALFGFGSESDIEKFKILRSENPLDNELDRGDKGLFMHKSSIYIWALPFFVFIIIGIVLYFYLKTQNRSRHS